MAIKSSLRSLFLVLLLAGASIGMPLRAQQTNEQLASYYYQNKEYAKAVELYTQLYASTKNRFYFQTLFSIYMETEAFKDAEKLVRKRIDQHPEELDLHVYLGRALLAKGDKRKAAKSFDAPLALIKRDNQQVLNLVEAYTAAKLFDKAVLVYKTVRERTGNHYLYVIELSELYQRMGKYEEMMQEYFDLLDNMPSYMGNIQLSLQRMLQESTNSKLSEGLRSALVSRIREHPENRSYTSMMIWYSMQERDFDFALEQAQAIDARFPHEQESQVMQVAQIAANNEAFEVAARGYESVMRRGENTNMFIDAYVGWLDARYKLVKQREVAPEKETHALVQDYEAALNKLGKSPKTISLMRHYSNLLAYNADNRLQEASDLLYDILDMPRVAPQVRDEVKLELGDLLLFAGEMWDASLLYSQVEKSNKNDVLGSLAKFKNAKLSYFTHDFMWAKSQLDVLRASTSKLIANDAMELSLMIGDNMEVDSTFALLSDYADAELLLLRGRLNEALEAFDMVSHKALSHPLFDDVLMQKARIKIAQKRYAEADSLLQSLVNLYASDLLADDALMLLAELNDFTLGNVQRAKSCYEQLILDYPSSLHADVARRRLEEMRHQQASTSH